MKTPRYVTGDLFSKSGLEFAARHYHGPNKVLLGKPNYVAGVNPDDLTGLAGLVNTQRLSAAQRYREAMKKAISKEPDCRMKTKVLDYLDKAKKEGGYVQSEKLMDAVRKSMRPSALDKAARNAVFKNFGGVKQGLQKAAERLDKRHSPAKISDCKLQMTTLFATAIKELETQLNNIEVSTNRSDAQRDLSSCLTEAREELTRVLDDWQAECQGGDHIPSMHTLWESLGRQTAQLARVTGFEEKSVPPTPYGTWLPAVLVGSKGLRKTTHERVLGILSTHQKDGSRTTISAPDRKQLESEFKKLQIPPSSGAAKAPSTSASPLGDNLTAKLTSLIKNQGANYHEIRALYKEVQAWPGYASVGAPAVKAADTPTLDQIHQRDELIRRLILGRNTVEKAPSGSAMNALRDEVKKLPLDALSPRLRREVESLKKVLAPNTVVTYQRLDRAVKDLRNLLGYPNKLAEEIYEATLRLQMQKQVDELEDWWVTKQCQPSGAQIPPTIVASQIQLGIAALLANPDAKPNGPNERFSWTELREKLLALHQKFDRPNGKYANRSDSELMDLMRTDLGRCYR